MRDLLVFLCGANHLNPTQFHLEAKNAEGAEVTFKPNHKLANLDNVEDVLIVPKKAPQCKRQ